MAGHDVRKKTGRNGAEITAYFCPNCNMWHFSSTRHKYLVTIDLMKVEIAAYKTEISYLKGQIKQMEGRQLNLDRRELLKDKIFDDLNRNNAELKKTNSRLRKDNHDLVAKLNAKMKESNQVGEWINISDYDVGIHGKECVVKCNTDIYPEIIFAASFIESTWWTSYPDGHLRTCTPVLFKPNKAIK